MLLARTQLPQRALPSADKRGVLVRKDHSKFSTRLLGITQTSENGLERIYDLGVPPRLRHSTPAYKAFETVAKGFTLGRVTGPSLRCDVYELFIGSEDRIPSAGGFPPGVMVRGRVRSRAAEVHHWSGLGQLPSSPLQEAIELQHRQSRG